MRNREVAASGTVLADTSVAAVLCVQLYSLTAGDRVVADPAALLVQLAPSPTVRL
jgi:hypothetical protein